jgi:hypothetical protein
MSKPINPELTGPGSCNVCGQWVADRPAKGLCRPCYDRQYRTTDPLARAELQQKAIDRAPTKLVQIQAMIKKLRDDLIVDQLDYIIVHRICQVYLDRLRDMTSSDFKQQEDEAMNQVEVAPRNIQPNPNPVEVEDISNQPST